MGTCKGRSSSFLQSVPGGNDGAGFEPWSIGVRKRGTERIGTEQIVLVVDPYDSGRSAIRESLEAQGCFVLEATSMQRAVSAWQACAGAIDVVLTEVLLPDADGERLVNELTSRGANLRVVFMHAVPAYERLVRRAVRHPHLACLQKPIDLEELASAIRAFG